MAAKLNHLAIVTENYTLSGTFYQELFGLRAFSSSRKSIAGRAYAVHDGYVGINLNPRSAGRAARFDHFGAEVTDVDAAFKRLEKHGVEWLKRPSNRPFASYTTHDPDGNIFDLSQKDAENRADVYAESGKPLTERHVDHFALRTMRPKGMAEFYCDVLGLEQHTNGDANYYLSDGHITLVIMPWHITDFAGTGIAGAALDHIGFAVEDLEKFKADVATLTDSNPRLAPYPFESGAEGKVRAELERKSCQRCQYLLADVDGVFLSARS
ncbi:MAG TPA: VOC family protein [Candidatus Binatia bacterium]|nr:VOC family protein [Candidatus Binatia bacterium]